MLIARDTRRASLAGYHFEVSSLRRDVEAEPLFRQRLDRAIRLCSGNRVVEHGLQFRVALTQANGTATAEEPALEAWTCRRHVFVARLLGSRRQIGHGRHNDINTTGLEIEIMLFRRLVFSDVDD